ncbi:MAG: hypothetical protein HN368_12235 [Spirochaetales bacterium]|jgi:hypothetical protein|nr:hypothetical protein [Spirochaetales bacterium]
MSVGDSLAGIPKDGFLKISRPDHSSLTSQQRSALIRKGNELFNSGQFDQAKRIFVATGYGDGIIRIGDYYLKRHEPLEALRMYLMASAKDKAEHIYQGAASVVQSWLQEDPAQYVGSVNKRDER